MSMNDPLFSSADLEQVGVVIESGDHIDVYIDDDLLWAVGEKLYRFKDVAKAAECGADFRVVIICPLCKKANGHRYGCSNAPLPNPPQAEEQEARA
ncbi:hypothetical protein EVC28_055 [Rhizobium phage RHph_I1_23]|nr:hypothetical protein EVC28_055 [Rhizobium phage RHph_I1_23]